MTDCGGPRCLLIWTLVGILCGGFVSSQEQNCTHVKCPQMSEIQCPEDSYAHEFQEFTAISADEEHGGIVEEVMVNCCLTKKCSCRECHIPSCHNASLVLIETQPGSAVPGRCCATYDCVLEPNCAETDRPTAHWLVDCQRCKCMAGQKICHQSCDEVRPPPSNCLSQNFTVFKNGQTWKEDECTQCECQRGEKKCQTSFCRPLDCAHKVKPENECCPVCVIREEADTEEPQVESTEKPPCPKTEASNTVSSVRTEVIEVVTPSKQNCILYGVIVALSIVLVVFVALYLHERSKQRSYRPVSALDDNFNKITGKIKAKEFTFA